MYVKIHQALYLYHLFVVVQSLSHVQFFVTPWTAAHQASLSFTVSWSLPKLMSIESVMLPNHLILCCPLLLLTSIFPNIRVLSNESILASDGQSIGASESAPVLPMSIQDCFPLGWTGWIDVQGTLKNFLQHHSSKASILLHSAFFMFQIPHLYITTGKTITLLYGPLLAKQHLFSLTCCLGLS